VAAGIRVIQLYVLDPESARRFLVTRTGRTAEGAEQAACSDLARELGYLPLALEQAAAYIAAPGAGLNFAGYLRLYREATAELLARGALGSTEYPDPVITTWQATVAKLSPESRGVLRLCAWYADTPIPRALVMQRVEDVQALAQSFGAAAPVVGSAAAELRMRDALTGLARYSMILDATDTTFRVHGLLFVYFHLAFRQLLSSVILQAPQSEPGEAATCQHQFRRSADLPGTRQDARTA
jgi:hypothetical protein